MDTEEIENLRKVYNKEHSNETPIPTGTIHSVWKEIKKRLHKKCKESTSQCIIHSMMNKPKAPSSWIKNPHEWLSSIDIEKSRKTIFKSIFKILFCWLCSY